MNLFNRLLPKILRYFNNHNNLEPKKMIKIQTNQPRIFRKEEIVKNLIKVKSANESDSFISRQNSFSELA